MSSVDNPRNHVLSLWLVYTICNLIVKIVKTYQTMSESPFLSRITINLAVWMMEYIWDLSPRNFGPVFFTGFPFRIVPPACQGSAWVDIFNFCLLPTIWSLLVGGWTNRFWKDMCKSLRLRFKIADLTPTTNPNLRGAPWLSNEFWEASNATALKK